MSFSFQLWNKPGILWNPSNGPGRTYVGIAQVIAADDRFPDLGTWLNSLAPNEIVGDNYIDAGRMAEFLRAVLDSSVVDNETYLSLARGFLEYSLAMLFRAGGDMEAKNERQADLIQAARDIERRLLG